MAGGKVHACVEKGKLPHRGWRIRMKGSPKARQRTTIALRGKREKELGLRENATSATRWGDRLLNKQKTKPDVQNSH